jgi:hypothetical protein
MFDIRLHWIKINNKAGYTFKVNDIYYTIGVMYV